MASKRPVTANQSSLNDDRITDILFDKMGFSPSIRKFTEKYIPLKIPEKEIAKVLKKVTRQRNESEAISGLLELLCSHGYFSQLSEPLYFQCQLELYIKAYLPDCPFEINTTTRYSRTPEACITARKSIKKGVIKYLCGILVPLTEEEEKRLVTTCCDFTIVISSRKDSISLFLGPGRFINHDCEPNAKLNSTKDGIQVEAIRYINIGEEITVRYGNDYFGENNYECLCATCAFLQRNGWTINKKETGISASFSTKNNESHLRVTTTNRRRNTRLRTHACDIQMLHCAICRLKNQVCVRCTRHMKLYGHKWPATESPMRKDCLL